MDDRKKLIFLKKAAKLLNSLNTPDKNVIVLDQSFERIPLGVFAKNLSRGGKNKALYASLETGDSFERDTNFLTLLASDEEAKKSLQEQIKKLEQKIRAESISKALEGHPDLVAQQQAKAVISQPVQKAVEYAKLADTQKPSQTTENNYDFAITQEAEKDLLQYNDLLEDSDSTEEKGGQPVLALKELSQKNEKSSDISVPKVSEEILNSRKTAESLLSRTNLYKLQQVFGSLIKKLYFNNRLFLSRILPTFTGAIVGSTLGPEGATLGGVFGGVILPEFVKRGGGSSVFKGINITLNVAGRGIHTTSLVMGGTSRIVTSVGTRLLLLSSPLSLVVVSILILLLLIGILPLLYSNTKSSAILTPWSEVTLMPEVSPGPLPEVSIPPISLGPTPGCEEVYFAIKTQFQINMEGFDCLYLQFAYQKFAQLNSSTRFISLVRGSVIQKWDGRYSEQLGCPGDPSKPVTIHLKQYADHDLFNVVLTHELGHVINHCPDERLIPYPDTKLTYVEMHSRNYEFGEKALTCYGKYGGVTENFADMIAYFLNPNSPSRTFPVGTNCVIEPNPFTGGRYPVYYDIARRILLK